jgi:hypothetical protein
MPDGLSLTSTQELLLCILVWLFKQMNKIESRVIMRNTLHWIRDTLSTSISKQAHKCHSDSMDNIVQDMPRRNAETLSALMAVHVSSGTGANIHAAHTWG